MIPVVNNEFYPRWFLLDLLCLHSSVLCKNPVTSLYLAGVSPNFLIVFCIKSLMLDLTKYIQILHNLSCVHLSVNSSDALPTHNKRPVPRRQRGPEGLQQAISHETAMNIAEPVTCDRMEHPSGICPVVIYWVLRLIDSQFCVPISNGCVSLCSTS